MRLFIVAFLIVMILLTAGIGAGAVLATARALSLGEITGLSRILSDVKKDLSALYEEADVDEKTDIERISDRLDDATAMVAKRRVFRSYYYNRLIIGLGAVISAVGISAFLLWLFTLKTIVRPLEELQVSVRGFNAEGASPDIEARGVREIRELSAALGGMMRDLKTAGDRIRLMERANIGRFLVHQIRNSVTSIELCSSGLPKDTSEGGIILEETGRISRLLERFHLMYRFPEPVKTPVELNSFGADILRQAPSVILDQESEPVWIEADVMLLSEAVLNLIRNALEALAETPDSSRTGGRGNGAVRLTIRGGEAPYLSVSDNGRGMEPAELDLSFNEYYTTKQNGMGLGLSFVKKVADSHGFGLKLRSKPGVGTQARMTFS